MTRPLLLLAAVTLCCCITSMHGFAGPTSCRCIRTVDTPVPVRAIKKIEVIPVSGHCRRTEIIITTKRDRTICVNPQATWIQDLINKVQTRNGMSSSTTDSPTASTIYNQ